MIKQGYLMEYNWEREISPYAAVKEGLSKKVTEASGQRAHGHKQESSSHTHTHTHPLLS